MINLWPLLEISLVWLCQASHVKYEYLLTSEILECNLCRALHYIIYARKLISKLVCFSSLLQIL